MDSKAEVLKVLKEMREEFGPFEFKVVLKESDLTLATPGYVDEEEILKAARRRTARRRQ